MIDFYEFDDIHGLNREGLGDKSPALQLRNECVRNMHHMAPGRFGIVLGSGPNTNEWHNRGWSTLDIDPQYGAQFTQDANQIELNPAIAKGTWDLVLAEAIKIDPTGASGVNAARLMNQASLLLKPGGVFIMSTAHFEGNPASTLPDKNKYAPLLDRNGFDVIVEDGRYVHYAQPTGEPAASQKIVYYAKKRGTLNTSVATISPSS